MLLAPVNPADELDCVPGAEDVADVCIEEILDDEVGPVDPDDADDALAVPVSTAVAAAMIPPPTFWGATAFALAAADL